MVMCQACKQDVPNLIDHLQEVNWHRRPGGHRGIVRYSERYPAPKEPEPAPQRKGD